MSDEWQPIETAPKDGTRLLLAWKCFDYEDPCYRIEFGSWRCDNNDYDNLEPGWFDESYDDWSTGYASSPLEPSHWKLPPSPPND